MDATDVGAELLPHERGLPPTDKPCAGISGGSIHLYVGAWHRALSLDDARHFRSQFAEAAGRARNRNGRVAVYLTSGRRTLSVAAAELFLVTLDAAIAALNNEQESGQCR